jgi:ankyrin repeat protein
MNLVDKNGQSALLHAAAKKHSQSVQIMMEKGADMDLVDRNG